jgi:lactoylglutathione lyase
MNQFNSVECVTLFVDDLNSTKKFYTEVFGLKVIYEDPQCAVVRFENILFNLLKAASAPELIAPAQVGVSAQGPRLMFTIKVDHIDASVEQLKKHQVKMLNGPIDRPWGRRTAAFLDPAGQAWELAQEL